MSIAPTRRRPKALIALGALALALAAAGPASAEPNQPTTTKKDCTFTWPDGGTATFKHGEKVTIRMKGDNNITVEVAYRCNDGKWEPAIPLYVQPTATTVSVSTLSAYSTPGP
jgi:hypothetical protein